MRKFALLVAVMAVAVLPATAAMAQTSDGQVIVVHGVPDLEVDVYVNGEEVVRNRTVLTIDQEDALDRLEAGQKRALARVPEMDWAKRTAEEISPICLPRL